ncbi:hypothetical protein [Streptomyces violascens]|uniref:Uncharacterized protein n=1 Tax=Streptomyces violascens TaxID=67381 RepID=A0ABQ3QTX7_9ACTN|nr:hypothetical protein [Streptomyces violascens]GHI40693.1 hypothetical protein Sviol_51010 [Streptomyces violascens]
MVLALGNLCAFVGDLASGRSGDPYYRQRKAPAPFSLAGVVSTAGRHQRLMEGVLSPTEFGA